jgi:hypothetical protein
MSFFISFHQCKFEVYFVQDKFCYLCLFSGAICLVELPAFHSQPVLISVSEVGLLLAADFWIFLFILLANQ